MMHNIKTHVDLYHQKGPKNSKILLRSTLPKAVGTLVLFFSNFLLYQRRIYEMFVVNHVSTKALNIELNGDVNSS